MNDNNEGIYLVFGKFKLILNGNKTNVIKIRDFYTIEHIGVYLIMI